jgi:hypothetical protein
VPALIALPSCGPSGECIDVAAASKRLSYGMTVAEVKQAIPAKPDFTGKSPVEEYRVYSYCDKDGGPYLDLYFHDGKLGRAKFSTYIEKEDRTVKEDIELPGAPD